jgi:hypothetical protein
MKLVSMILIAAVLLTGCTSALPDEGNSMPEQMPGDFAFSVHFGFGGKNAIDSFRGIVVKDLISAGTAEASLTFTNEEMASIYEKMKEIDVLGPKHFAGDSRCTRVPAGEDTWKIRMNGKERTIRVPLQHCVTPKDAQQMIDLRNWVLNIVKEKDAYKTLPEAEGGYE